MWIVIGLVVVILIALAVATNRADPQEVIADLEVRREALRRQNAAEEADAKRRVELQLGRKGDITALCRAALNGDNELILAAHDAGVDVNTADSDGWTMLHAAAAGGQVETIELLLHLGADKTRCNHDGSTPQRVAANARKRDAFDTLS